jgi:hypothetical protein
LRVAGKKGIGLKPQGIGSKISDKRVTGCEVRVSVGMKHLAEGVRSKAKGKRTKDMGRRQSVKQAGLKKSHALVSVL